MMKMKKWMRSAALLMAGAVFMCGCGSKGADGADVSQETESETAQTQEVVETVEKTESDQTEIQVFIAASLSDVMEEIASGFMTDHPEVVINFNADSSGTLLQQIEEGFACDIFFSAAQKQMNVLEEDGLVVDGTRANVVNNQVCVVSYKGSNTAVTGLGTIGLASSIALADGSVPVGKYTRQAMLNLGMITAAGAEGEEVDPAALTTAQISEALGGVEISEQGNVSKVRTAVLEGSCEVGTVYYSDTYGYEDQLDIIEMVPYDLTGNVIYPVCMVSNDEADDAETAAARAFYEYILSDEAKGIFDTYLFDTNVEQSNE